MCSITCQVPGIRLTVDYRILPFSLLSVCVYVCAWCFVFSLSILTHDLLIPQARGINGSLKRAVIFQCVCVFVAAIIPLFCLSLIHI